VSDPGGPAKGNLNRLGRRGPDPSSTAIRPVARGVVESMRREGASWHGCGLTRSHVRVSRGTYANYAPRQNVTVSGRVPCATRSRRTEDELIGGFIRGSPETGSMDAELRKGKDGDGAC